HDPPGAGERLPAGGGHHPAGVLQPLHARMHGALPGPRHPAPPGFSAGVGPGAGAGRPCGRQYHVHEEHTGGRGREGEGHPDLWTSLYPTGTAAPGLWQAADGGVLPAGVRHGVRGYCDLRRSQQLRGPRLPKLQKAPGPSGGRDVS
ncbi:DUF3842 domain-containing protein, partial [Dysosmobacter welbionis]